MKTIKVSKQKLLKAISENRKIHETEYNELQELYLIDVEVGLEKLLEQAKLRKSNPITSLDIVKPRSYVSEYDEVIGMLKFSSDSEFEITQEEYKKYVLNIWNWTSSFDMIKTAYIR